LRKLRRLSAEVLVAMSGGIIADEPAETIGD
jgi:hypothetical protein